MIKQERTVPTLYGDISLFDNRGEGSAIIMIHGNSFSKDVFEAQFGCSLASTFRLIALDLPGHGSSPNAIDADLTYTLPILANIVREVAQVLNIERAVLAGWSLGGHVAIEAISRWPGLAGVMLFGTPPIRRMIEDINAAMAPSPVLELAHREEWSVNDASTYVSGLCGDLGKKFICKAIRADGRARSRIASSYLAGQGADQRLTVEASSVPIAVVHGAGDAIIRSDYLAQICFANLWRGRIFSFLNCGHAPFLEDAPQFNDLLADFAQSVSDAR